MKTLQFDTLQVHAGQKVDAETLSRAVPLYQTTAYLFKNAQHGANLFALKEFGNIYTRLQNPTTDVFEQRMAALEGGIGALATSSGMAAELIALTNIMSVGDNFISSPYLYGGTFNLFKNTLPNMGIECRMAQSNDPEEMAKLIDGKSKAIYVESIGNPAFAVPDFEALAALAHSNGIPLIVDNTFGCGGYLCRPLDLGADIVVESATKWIGGHGTSMGGVIIDAGRFDWAASGKFPCMSEPSEGYHGLRYAETFGALAYIIKARVERLRDLGACQSPFNSRDLLLGLETLSLRVQREADNTMALAQWFNNHPKVEKVFYPGLASDPYHSNAKRYLQNGFGCVLSVMLRGDKASTARFVDSLKLVSHLANVGDCRSLVIHPASTTHFRMSDEALAQAGIGQGTIRLSIGLEDA
ncbi:MAG: O-acetylhomoserine aminocarboxypropyltransferase/cysteine synthase family protein, partial [Mucinivorans sp.]